jgi:activator of HSP90 ATPase
MTTRGGARDKIAKVMERVHSGGIAEGNPNQPEDNNTSMTEKANKVKAMKPSARKKVGATKAASMAKKPRTTKKIDSTAAKEADVAAKKALAAKLAQLEDKFLKKADISHLSHPRQWKGKVQGSTAPL